MIWLLVPVAYLVGGLPFGLLIGHRYGVDVRTVGSRNIGATNVWRTCGWRPGLLALLLDIFKGCLPTLLALRLASGVEHTAVHLATAAAAVLGHSFSPYLRFRGGKAVATSLGAALALVPLAAAAGFAAFVALLALTRYVSVGSLGGALALGLTTSLLGSHPAVQVVVWVLVALVWVRHRANLGRLWRGEESRFNLRGRTVPQESKTA